MNREGADNSAATGLLRRHGFRIFKYSIYLLLSYNAFLFFLENHAAAGKVFVDGVSFNNLVDAYSDTIDTISWVVLLLIFELETAVIDDRYLVGPLKWFLNLLRGLCYVIIVMAFFGYYNKLLLVSNTLPVAVDSACSLLGQGYSMVLDLDDYPALDADNCGQLGNAIEQIQGTQIIGSSSAIFDAVKLAVVDVLNSGAWLLVVLMLEIELYLQLKGLLTKRLLFVAKFAKGGVYFLLLVAAIYWGIKGDFLDFWDAFLWLVAFIFIEKNFFDWNAETRSQTPARALS